MTIQPARHECHACCPLQAEKPGIQPVVGNTHDAHVEQVVSSFQKILRGSQLTWYYLVRSDPRAVVQACFRPLIIREVDCKFLPQVDDPERSSSVVPFCLAAHAFGGEVNLICHTHTYTSNLRDCTSFFSCSTFSRSVKTKHPLWEMLTCFACETG